MTRGSVRYSRLITAYAVFIAVSAYGGSVGLLSGVLSLPPSLAHRLPLQSPVLAGVALACVVGVPCTVVAVLGSRAHRRTADAATLAGLALVGWILVEVAILREFSPLQPVYAAAGLGLVLLGNRRFGPQSSPAPVPPDPIREAPPWSVDLYWIPLGAGGHCVRLNGKVYETLAAWHERRPAQDLYHAALEVHRDGSRYVIEMAPVWNDRAADRGVVCVGPVGLRWLGRFRAFRYEVRCWPEGHIPDCEEAVASPQRLTTDPMAVATVLDLARQLPGLTWGRDELGAGEMWNSNSVVAWLLAGTGLDMAAIAPPPGGRAPGWNAGLCLGTKTTGRPASR